MSALSLQFHKPIADFPISQHMQVVVADKENFNYSSGEPPEGKLTVLRALKVFFVVLRDSRC